MEKGLREREAILFPQERALFLYDLTNTYFEGSAQKNELAHRGKSKEKRSDCPLVVLALVVDSQGLPIYSQIYKGNQSEPETLESILERLYCAQDSLFKETLPTIVMDRGIATKDNIALLQAKEYPYVVIERRAVEKDYVHEFDTAKETFEKISNASSGPVYVKKIESETGCRVLCLSEGLHASILMFHPLQVMILLALLRILLAVRLCMHWISNTPKMFIELITTYSCK